MEKTTITIQADFAGRKTATINGIVYWIANSTWYTDHSALFAKYPNGSVTENNCFREWSNIAASPDQLAAYNALWPK